MRCSLVTATNAELESSRRKYVELFQNKRRCVGQKVEAFVLFTCGSGQTESESGRIGGVGKQEWVFCEAMKRNRVGFWGYFGAKMLESRWVDWYGEAHMRVELVKAQKL